MTIVRPWQSMTQLEKFWENNRHLRVNSEFYQFYHYNKKVFNWSMFMV